MTEKCQMFPKLLECRPILIKCLQIIDQCFLNLDGCQENKDRFEHNNRLWLHFIHFCRCKIEPNLCKVLLKPLNIKPWRYFWAQPFGLCWNLLFQTVNGSFPKQEIRSYLIVGLFPPQYLTSRLGERSEGVISKVSLKWCLHRREN